MTERKIVILELDEHDAYDLAEALSEYNLPIMIKDGKMGTWREVPIEMQGMYDSIMTIEGKSTKGY